VKVQIQTTLPMQSKVDSRTQAKARMQSKVDSRTQAKARSSPSNKICPAHQSKRYSVGNAYAGSLLADDLWSWCGVSLSPQRSRKRSRRSASSIRDLPPWRRERQGDVSLAKKAPWALLAVRWQRAQPLQILIATERHARLRERSDEVSLDVQLWTLGPQAFGR
jgi:hypothetical protein